MPNFLNNSATLMFISALLAALSQIILKSSAVRQYENPWKNIFNSRVIFAYILLSCSLFLNLIAYKTVAYKWGPVIASTSYIYVIFLSRIIFGEKLTRRKILGSLIIVIGIIVFSM